MTSVFQTLSIYHYARNCRGKALRYKELSSKRKMRKQMHNWMQCSRHCDRRVCKFLLCEFVAVRFRSCFVLETEMFPLVCMVHSWAICVHWLSFGNFAIIHNINIYYTKLWMEVREIKLNLYHPLGILRKCVFYKLLLSFFFFIS